MSGIKSRIVEDWLTKAGELTFTIPFAQLLLSKGHSLIHISSQGPLEQGKDIISVGPDGEVNCYQLKSGRITSGVWGAIKAEIDQLVELPPRHPSLPGVPASWNAYLVTNGGIANPTARDIFDYSASKAERGHMPLRTITGGELSKDFADYYDEFFPNNAVDLQVFLTIFNQPGDADLDSAGVKLFLEDFFGKASDLSLQKKGEAVRGSLLLSHFALTQKFSSRNHVQVIRGLTLLLCSVYHFVSDSNLDEKEWIPTEQLIRVAIENEFRQLIDELAGLDWPTDFVRSEYGLLSEVVTLGLRTLELQGALGAYISMCHIEGSEPYKADELNPLLDKFDSPRSLLGEYMVPMAVNNILRLRLSGRAGDAASQLSNLLEAIIVSHDNDQSRGLPSPYYDLRTCVKWAYGMDGTEIKEGFRKRSYTIRTLVLLAALLDEREIIEAFWPSISTISAEELVPDNQVDLLLWRVADGTLRHEVPNATQSWSALTAESNRDWISMMPPIISNRRHLLPLVTFAMPHRFSPALVLPAFVQV